MDKFVVKGETQLNGTISVRGAKNAILPMIAGALLVEKGECIIHNVPNIRDIRNLVNLTELLGAKSRFDASEHTLTINAENLSYAEAPYDVVRKMRASFLVTGALLSRFGHARVALPGGCSIGARPVNLHIKGFERLGAKISEEKGYISARADRLKGETIYFDRPSHTGTENIMMAAVNAEGTTRIINAACDPEVKSFADFLNSMGAKIYGAGTPYIMIEGVSALSPTEFNPIGDRLEAGTYLYGALITGGDVEVSGVDPQHLEFPILKMREMGAKIKTTPTSIRLRMRGKPKSINLTTFPYPGFPTDLQPMAMTAATICDGTSYIRETVFENRFSHVMELLRLGGIITVAGDTATVTGTEKLHGAEVMASDIRAGAALALAGLVAEGETEILRVYHIDRGYERLEEKLSSLGASIERTQQ